MIYLDNAASTAVRPEVLREMLPHLSENFGNPSSAHAQGRAAERAVRLARRRAAALIGASPGEILFTSGGTESNNMALLGAAGAAGGGLAVVATSVEHEAVLEPCRLLEEQGCELALLRADGDGMIDAAELGPLLDGLAGRPRLVSVMLANNEVGTIQPVAEAARACRARGVPIHTDAVQAAGKIPIDVSELGVDMLSLSSHKIHGPKGAGALYVRRGTRIAPVIRGGGQEGGMRSGTENVPAIVGFGAACELAASELGTAAPRMRALRDRLVSRVMGAVPHCAANGHPGRRLPNCAHLTVLGVSGEDLVAKLDERGIAASTGSACTVRTQKESHVLRAMGLSHERISGSLRLSLGAFTTEREVDEAARILAEVAAELRRVSPFREKYGF